MSHQVLILVLAVLAAIGANGQSAENLALHKPYTMAPAPNYHYHESPMCTGPGNKTCLTDGIRATCRGGYLWWCKDTEALGVSVAPADKVFRVVIDLQRTNAIGRVMVSTSHRCPEADVTMNSFALALSPDGKTYQVLDRITPLEPLRSPEEREKPQQGFAVNLDGGGIRARYVCVVAIPNSLITMDEIEVYPAAGVVAPRPPTFECDYAGLRDRLGVAAERPALDQPLFAELSADLLRDPQNPEQKYFLAQLQDLQMKHQRALLESAAVCANVVSQLAPLATEWNRSRLSGQPDLLVWPANPYETPLMFTVPEGRPATQVLRLLGNQKGIAALNVCWKGGQPVRLEVSVAGPPGVELRRAWRTTALTAVGTMRVADALVLEKDNPLTLTPGVVEQLLLVIPPGQGGRSDTWTVRLQAAGVTALTHRVRVERAPLSLPATFDAIQGGWFYLDCDTKLVPVAAAARYLKDCHMNVAMLSGGCVARPVFNARGDVVKPAGPSSLGQFTRQLSFCRYFYLFFTPDHLHWETGRPPAETNIVARAWAECLREEIARLKPLGIRADQLLLAPADEDGRAEKWVPFHQALERLPRPRPKLFCTAGLPAQDSPEITEWIKAVDIFVLKGPWYLPGADPANLLPRMRANGKEVWSYDCGSTTASLPNHYRLSSWQMLAAGSRGNLWWTYTGDQPQWATPGSGYGLYYGQRGAPAELKITEDLVPSRRAEAWRVGIEDRWLLETARSLARRQSGRNCLVPITLAYMQEHLDKALADPEDAGVPEETRQWLTRLVGALTPRE